jgi:hypothetical protein
MSTKICLARLDLYYLVDRDQKKREIILLILEEDMKVELLNSITTPGRNMISRVSAYMATLYYLEIISLMFGLLFLYGKAVSIIAGTALTLFLTFHIIRLYFTIDLHRKIQLFIIDIHVAFAAGYLFYNISQETPLDPAALAILGMRTFIMVCEMPLLCLLTGDEARKEFS